MLYSETYVMTKPVLQSKATKILIVEDEGEVCLVLNLILNGENMELDHVKNLLDAEEYLQKEQPSLIILDNKLPDGFGVDFISYLKKKYPSIKIIMISGFRSVKDVALQNGADVFLEKPFGMPQLSEAVKTLLN